MKKENQNQTFIEKQSNFSKEIFGLVGCLQNKQISDSQAKKLSEVYNLKSQKDMLGTLSDITRELIDVFGIDEKEQISGLLELLLEFANKWGDRGVDGLAQYIKVFRFQCLISNDVDPLMKALVSQIKHDINLPSECSIYETFTFNYTNLN